MSGYEQQTYVIAQVLENLSSSGGCGDPGHGARTMWQDEAEHIVEALVDYGMLK